MSRETTAASSAARLAAARRRQRIGVSTSSGAPSSTPAAPDGGGANYYEGNAALQQSSLSSGGRGTVAAAAAAARRTATPASVSASAAASRRPLPSLTTAHAPAASLCEAPPAHPPPPASPYKDEGLSRMNERIAMQAALALDSARKGRKQDNRPTTTGTSFSSSTGEGLELERKRLPFSTAAATTAVDTAAAAVPVRTSVEVRGGDPSTAVQRARHPAPPYDPLPPAPAVLPKYEPTAAVSFSSTSPRHYQQQPQQQQLLPQATVAAADSSSRAAETAPQPQFRQSSRQPSSSTTTGRNPAASLYSSSSYAAPPHQQTHRQLPTTGTSRMTSTTTAAPTTTTTTSATSSRPQQQPSTTTTTGRGTLSSVTSSQTQQQQRRTATTTSRSGASAASRFQTTAETTSRNKNAAGSSTVDGSPTKQQNWKDTTAEGEILTIEEMEDSIVAATPERPVDAACLLYSSGVILRNRQEYDRSLLLRPRDVMVAGQGNKGQGDEADPTATASTSAGKDEVDDEVTMRLEAWRLLPAETSSGSTSRPLCYGDTILLVFSSSSSKKAQVLGASRQDEPRGGASTAASGSGHSLFRVRGLPYSAASSTASSSAAWTVLRALPNDPRGLVRIGRSAVERSQQKKPKKRGMAAAARVFSGDAVLLRHTQTGFLLSLRSAEDGSTGVELVMDSYNTRIPKDGDNTNLLDRLQHHDLYLPSDREIFHLILSTVPPSTPLWISSAVDKRSYLEGSYLSAAERNRESPAEEILFGRPSSSHTLDCSQQAEASRQKQLQAPLGQEMALFDELIASFLGLEGRFIMASSLREQGRVQFQLHATEDVVFDPSLSSLVREMLPLSTAYANVRHFVSSHIPGYEYGSVMQALCEQLDAFLHEYGSVFVKGLDEQYRQQQDGASLSLTQLLFQVRPTMHRMSVLQQAVDSARCEKGGALLNSLRKLKQRLDGDPVASEILGRLMDVAAVPYMKMFSRWMQCGVLDDPYGEFMVVQKSDTNTGWEKSYSLTHLHALEGFCSSKQTVTRVLATGRYWSAIRTCQEEMRQSKCGSEDSDHDDGFPVLLYSTKAASVAACVQSVHRRASKLLVRLLMNDFALVDSLRLMKRYFLLDQGDFFVNFMDAAEGELLKEISRVSQGRIQHWLDTAVQLAEHQEGGFSPPSPRGRDSAKSRQLLSPTNLQSRFESESLMDHLDSLHAESGGIDTHEAPTPLRHAYGEMLPDSLTGLGAFGIDYTPVPFPISLVLAPPAMASYQLLFRHLFYAKYVERRLVGVWQDHQAFRELQSLRGALGPTFLLRQRMLHFLQNLIYYMMVEVIEPNWLELERSIVEITAPESENETLDDIIRVHTNFLSKSLEACLLTKRDLLRALTKLMSTCLLFSDQMRQFMEATKIDDDRRRTAIEKRRVVQRNLNDRGGSRRAERLVEETLRNDHAERKERVKQQTARVSREVSSESYRGMIARFDQVFSDHLCDFMLRLKHSDAVVSDKVNLCIRLDYNGYLSNALGLASKSKRHLSNLSVGASADAGSSVASNSIMKTR